MKRLPKKIRNFVIAASLLLFLAAGSFAQAADGVNQALFSAPDFQVNIPGMDKLTSVTCQEGAECEIPWIAQYINGLYKYGFSIAGILASLVLMAAGLLWIVSGGDSTRIIKAKNMIIGSLSGLVILGASYMILYQINPQLVSLQSIGVNTIAAIDIPQPDDTVAFAGKCKEVDSGNCAVSNMSGFGSKAQQASAICMAESGGNASAYNKATRCTGGEYAVWGLFQFNLSAATFVDGSGKTLQCYKAFNKAWTESKPSCTVVNESLYEACKAAAVNSSLSIKNAQILVNKSSGWGPWEANSKFCKF